MNGDAEVLETKFFATEGGPLVSAILMRPGDAHAFMLLGHGVGMSVEHPVMVRTASALAGQGIATFRFNYPYSELGRQPDWGTSLDPLKVLLATACSAVGFAAKAAEGLPFFVGGRSMSSQLVSLAVAEGMIPGGRGVVLFSYPMRWRTLLDDPAAHLKNVITPMLVVQGERDDQADLEELQPIVEGLGERHSEGH